jgi:magnesium transporter
VRSIILDLKKAGKNAHTAASSGGGGAAQFSCVLFNEDGGTLQNPAAFDDVCRAHTSDSIRWINVNGLQDAQAVKRIAERYELHPLTVEDILDPDQQPKIETFETYRYISIKAILQKTFCEPARKRTFPFIRTQPKRETQDEDGLLISQISIIVMESTLITFIQTPEEFFEGVRKKILDNAALVRKMGTNSIVYLLINAVVDEYYITLDSLEKDIEDFEDRAGKTNDDTFITEILDTKKYLLQVKRIALPLRSNLFVISQQETPFISDDLKPFLQDVRENLNNVIETIENYREWLSNIMDVNLSVLSHQMNKVMKTLAIISTIFIPLTFIVGVYGMNFINMPEIKEPLGYPVVLAGMAAIAAVMLAAFKYKRWF